MERKRWTVDIEGNRHTVELEHRPNRGSIRLDGRLIERWKLSEDGDTHHPFRIGGRCCAVHVRFDAEERAYRYDLSVEGKSLATGGEVPPFRPSPTESGFRTWTFDLEDGTHELTLEHRESDRRIIRLDGTVMEDSDFLEEKDSHHLLHFKGHRLGVHLHWVAPFVYRYDLSVDGVSVDTGFGLPPFAASPVDCRKKAWVLELEGRTHVVELEIRPFSERKTILVDGQAVLRTGWFPDEGDARYPFLIGDHWCAIHIKKESIMHSRYELLLDGRSIDTGETADGRGSDDTGQPAGNSRPVDTGPQVRDVDDRKRSWVLELEDGVHEVTAEERWSGVLVTVDGERIKLSVNVDERDLYCPFTVGGRSCAVWVHRRMLTFRKRLLLDGICVETGEKPIPLKAVNGKRRIWVVELGGKVRPIELEHKWTGRKRLFVDGKLVLDKRGFWQLESRHLFEVDGHICILSIHYDGNIDNYHYDLYIDGWLVETGKPPGEPKIRNREEAEAFIRKLGRKVDWRKLGQEMIKSYLLLVPLFFVFHYLIGTRWLKWFEPQPISYSLFYYLLFPAVLTIFRVLEGIQIGRWIIYGGGVGVILVILGILLYETVFVN